MLSWAQQFSIFCFLDNQNYELPQHRFECLLAVEAVAQVDSSRDPFEAVDQLQSNNYWTFGHINFEAFHQEFSINSIKPDPHPFPEFFFFRPKWVLKISGNELIVEGEKAASIFETINLCKPPAFNERSISIQPQLTKESYIAKIKSLLQHIHRGDCYEINFCQVFSGANCLIDPLQIFQRLLELAPNPYAAFYKWNEQYLLCASPERFLAKGGSRLMAQPMKGTAKRIQDAAADEQQKSLLFKSAKERTENVMVVDLVRNDLSKVCKNVQVTDLFGIQSFPFVHQMVSTVEGDLMEGTTFSQIMRANFPMGSMTGAPKKRVLELINQYEDQKRGIFSGTVGYIDPAGDFDFNVVIRSLMYHAQTRYLSYQTGSGITANSDPEKEWEECLLKGAAIKKVLTG